MPEYLRDAPLPTPHDRHSAPRALGDCTDDYPHCYPSRSSMSRGALGPALLYVPPARGTQVRFRVVTPDHHPIAVTVEPALAAATALAVARHHPAHYAAIAGSDGRWLEVDLEGHTTLTPTTCDTVGWPALVARALGRLAPPAPHLQGATQ